VAIDNFAELVKQAQKATETPTRAAFIGSITGREPYPLEQWNPSHCGHVDIRIDREGTWFHEGSAIRRSELVTLFSSLLRREDDGKYYLVTPVEKCEITVDLHPLMVVDTTVITGGPDHERLGLVLNVGGIMPLNLESGLTPEPLAAGAAYIKLPRNLTALFTRAAWYRLVADADEAGTIVSGNDHFSLL
jgi:hypothetical protein